MNARTLPNLHCHDPFSRNGKALINVDISQGALPSLRTGFHYSVGIHPYSLSAPVAPRLQMLEKLLCHEEVAAVGECGLDRSVTTPLSFQEEALRAQIVLAERFRLPLLLHVVRAFDRLLALHKELRPKERWIIHGFRGGEALAGQLLSKGMSLSFGLRFQERSVAICPMERLFLETDCASEDLLPGLYEDIAKIKGVTAEALAESILRRLPGKEQA